jgi:hypothetical protein
MEERTKGKGDVYTYNPLHSAYGKITGLDSGAPGLSKCCPILLSLFPIAHRHILPPRSSVIEKETSFYLLADRA